MDQIAPRLRFDVPGTFAFKTATQRWPEILARVVDLFCTRRAALQNAYGEAAAGDVRAILAKVSEIRYRLATNKAMHFLTDSHHDVDAWNRLIEEKRVELGVDELLWFSVDWLFAECYIYRWLYSVVSQTAALSHYDYFQEQKLENFHETLSGAADIAKALRLACAEQLKPDKLKAELLGFLKASLWGNQFDLSLNVNGTSELEVLDVQKHAEQDAQILAHDFDAVLSKLLNLSGKRQVDIVLDNAGFELLADLALAEFLVSSRVADRVILHMKEIPWFVSDVVRHDVDDLIKTLMDQKLDDTEWVGTRIKHRLSEGTFEIRDHSFWTSPHTYCEMKKVAPNLYTELSTSNLIIFKGDLNYRKLMGDRSWPLQTPFKEALCGFAPAPLLALRTLKAETISGLSEPVVKKLSSEYGDSTDWMTTGKYAVAQYSA